MGARCALDDCILNDRTDLKWLGMAKNVKDSNGCLLITGWVEVRSDGTGGCDW